MSDDDERAGVYRLSDELRAMARRSFIAEKRAATSALGHWVYFVIGADLGHRYALKIGQTGAKDPKRRVRGGCTFSPGIEFVDAFKTVSTDGQVRAIAEEFGWTPVRATKLTIAGEEWMHPPDDPRLLFEFRHMARELIVGLEARCRENRATSFIDSYETVAYREGLDV
jgi:hypothetical protein